MSRRFEHWKAKLKKPELNPHAMRHGFATYLGRRGFQEHVIAALTGHKLGASSIVKHYIGAHSPDVRRAMECFWGDGGTALRNGVA